MLEPDGWLRSRRYGYPPGAEEFGDVPLSADVPRADTQAIAVMPVVSDDQETLGALGLSYDTPQEFGAGTRAFLEYAAHQCALALTRVRG